MKLCGVLQRGDIQIQDVSIEFNDKEFEQIWNVVNTQHITKENQQGMLVSLTFPKDMNGSFEHGVRYSLEGYVVLDADESHAVAYVIHIGEIAFQGGITVVHEGEIEKEKIQYILYGKDFWCSKADEGVDGW